jgi:hypothetical protein
MKKIFDKFWGFIKSFSLRRIILLVLPLVLVYLMIDKWALIDSFAQVFFKGHQKYIRYIAPLSIVVGIVHAYTGNANEHSLYLFKYLGPILASPLTCLTYSIIINSAFALIYIVCYDSQTILHYTSIDRTTLTYTLILLLAWSMFGMIKIIMDIVKTKPKEKFVGSISAANQINVTEQWEVNYWATQFNTTAEKVIQAVKVVGSSVESVKEYLTK